MWILDLYENFRKSKSKIENNKHNKKNYNFDDGFTGDRKTDMNSSNMYSVVSKSRNKKISNDNRDER